MLTEIETPHGKAQVLGRDGNGGITLQYAPGTPLPDDNRIAGLSPEAPFRVFPKDEVQEWIRFELR